MRMGSAYTGCQKENAFVGRNQVSKSGLMECMKLIAMAISCWYHRNQSNSVTRIWVPELTQKLRRKRRRRRQILQINCIRSLQWISVNASTGIHIDGSVRCETRAVRCGQTVHGKVEYQMKCTRENGGRLGDRIGGRVNERENEREVRMNWGDAANLSDHQDSLCLKTDAAKKRLEQGWADNCKTVVNKVCLTDGSPASD